MNMVLPFIFTPHKDLEINNCVYISNFGKKLIMISLHLLSPLWTQLPTY